MMVFNFPTVDHDIVSSVGQPKASGFPDLCTRIRGILYMPRTISYELNTTDGYLTALNTINGQEKDFVHTFEFCQGPSIPLRVV